MTQFSGTKEVPLDHVFSTEKFLDWAKDKVPNINPQLPLELHQFKGGQSNPTFLVKHNEQSYVLRRKPTGILLPSAHAIDREYKVISALSKHHFPVAKPLGYCSDVDVIGSEFYLMSFLQGRVFWDPRLPELSNTDRTHVFDAMNSVIAQMHALDPVAIGLEDYGRFGGYVQRQLDRWTKQYRASETEKIPAMDNLIDWLPQHIPHYDATSLVHGDFRLDNIIFDPVEPKILGVLDWELSTLGNPLSDFAYHAMVWRLSPSLFRGLGGVDIQSLKIPNEKTYLESYLERTGHVLESQKDWEFYIIFNMFRLSAILQGIMARALQGNASSDSALEAGKKAKPLAELAWEQVLKI
jgi:aminoglycoside phosphotransferase (APT) family kinase protein